VRVYVILDDSTGLAHPLGDAVESFIRREDAERFVEEVGGDDPEDAAKLRNRRTGADRYWRGELI
jgi:hypothetical protein